MGTERHAIGCMTGTSMDALDVALISCEGEGFDLRASVVAFDTHPLGALSSRLRAIAEGAPFDAQEYARVSRELGELHAVAIDELLRTSPRSPDVVVLPGQTLYHAPPLTLQLVNPWPVASCVRCPVLHDLRGADAHAGGQGAPITPLADWVLFRDDTRSRVVVNLGGFCNTTVLPCAAEPDGVRGFDLCACNHVLDTCARCVLDAPFDRDGEAAARGRIDRTMADRLRDLLDAQSEGGRSLGSGDECPAWCDAAAAGLAPDDVLATATAGVGDAIGGALSTHDGDVVIAGGGARNPVLVRTIGTSCGRTCTMTDRHGVGVQQREAVAMGVLGVLALDGVGITLPRVTGRTGGLRAEGSWIGVAT